jgi:threonine dehydrogenase-like Zn-dependent dehydrogenase
METAVNFLMDGRPMIGEQVLVSGQGIVGLLTTALLARFPLGSLVTLDRYLLRRQASLEIGAHASLDPESTESRTEIERWMPRGADLAYELSGAPQALDELIALTGFDGRVLIGSWYGQKRASLDLGGRFHRSRIRLISSQVSTLAPELLGRWNKSRRFQVVWDMLRAVHPERFITHRVPLTEAPKAYQLLDDCPEQSIQIVFTYTK